jgi:hypothetical protein
MHQVRPAGPAPGNKQDNADGWIRLGQRPAAANISCGRPEKRNRRRRVSVPDSPDHSQALEFREMQSPAGWYVGRVYRNERKRAPMPRYRLIMASVFLVGGACFLLTGLDTNNTTALVAGILFLVNVPLWVWRSRRDLKRQ